MFTEPVDPLCLDAYHCFIFYLIIYASSQAGACDDVFSLKVLVATQILGLVALEMFVHFSFATI